MPSRIVIRQFASVNPFLRSASVSIDILERGDIFSIKTGEMKYCKPFLSVRLLHTHSIIFFFPEYHFSFTDSQNVKN